MKVNKKFFFKKQSIILVVSLVIILGLFIYLELNNSTLEKYVNNAFPNATLHKINYDDSLVLFSWSDNNQYFLGKVMNVGRYYFNLYDEDDWVKDDELFLLKISYMKDIGNVVWGYFNFAEKVSRVELEYINAKNGLKYEQSFTVEKNGYFEYLPTEILNENFSYTQ